MKWMSKGKKKKYSLKRFFKSFGYGFKGFVSAIKTEQNLLIELVIAIIVIISGIFLKLTTVEWAIIVLTIGLVIFAELINTSIEYTVDMAMPEMHPLAKISKDVSAAAVLFASFISIVIGLLIFLPKIIDLFK